MKPQTQTQALTELATGLRRSVLHLARRIRNEHPQGAITPARLSVLRSLHEQGAMTAGQIAAADFLQAQSVTRLLASLEQDGLIVRGVDAEDRRRAVVTITRAGVDTLRENAAHRDEWIATAVKKSLGREEQALLKEAIALLDRIADEPGSSDRQE